MIPDEVVCKLDFQPGWSIRFRQHMAEYKKEFNRINYPSYWKYQDKHSEFRYRRFVEKQKAIYVIEDAITKESSRVRGSSIVANFNLRRSKSAAPAGQMPAGISLQRDSETDKF
jgi:hypothetical protein